MQANLQKTAAALQARGFDTHVFDTADEAVAFLLASIPAGEAVGIGGSVTVAQTHAADRLREAGHPVHWHQGAPAGQGPAIRRAAMLAPNYLCSANAVTGDGLILQIDGTGNRVSALCYGPSAVYLLVGRNKLVDGGYQEAMRRIKQVACPQNARRLGLHTPCASGSCDVSACQKPMCNLVLALEHAPGSKTTHVLLVDEELGY